VGKKTVKVLIKNRVSIFLYYAHLENIVKIIIILTHMKRISFLSPV